VHKIARGTPALQNPTPYDEARDQRTNHRNRAEISALASAAYHKKKKAQGKFSLGFPLKTIGLKF